MTYAGIANSWEPGTDPEYVRDRIDSLVSTRVLRRGLALRCSECAKLTFRSIDDVGQTNRCSRCSAVTELSRTAWRLPVEEPSWFYDLHPVVRELVQENGDAPLLAAYEIAKASRTFTDVAEMDLVEDGKRRAETDLLIHADHLIITGEVKTSNELHADPQGRKAAALKRALWADVARADQIVLATTQPAWAPTSIDAMKIAISHYPWPPGHCPDLITITGLGTDQIKTTTVA